MKRSELVNTAKELTELLFKGEGVDPPIDITLPAPELGKQILEASELILKKDQLTPATMKTLKALFLEELDYLEGKKMVDGEEKEWSVTDYFMHLGLLEDAVIPEDEDSLPGLVINAETMRELKDLSKSYDEFKPIRGVLTKYKTVDELRKAMMEMLEEEKVEVDPIEEEKKRVPAEKAELKPKMEVVKEEEKEPVKKKPIVEKEPQKTTTPKIKKEQKIKEEKFTRVMAIATVLKKNPKLASEKVIEQSDALYSKKTNAASNLKQTQRYYSKIMQVLEIFELV